MYVKRFRLLLFSIAAFVFSAGAMAAAPPAYFSEGDGYHKYLNLPVVSQVPSLVVDVLPVTATKSDAYLDNVACAEAKFRSTLTRAHGNYYTFAVAKMHTLAPSRYRQRPAAAQLI